MLYLYAFTDSPGVPPPATPGLEDAPLQHVAHRDIAAVVSPISTAQIQPTEVNLWQHEEAVEALMADRALLPVRFGTVLAGQAAMQSVLATHYDNFKASLARVRGHVELSVRVMWDSDEVQAPAADRSQPADGRSYLMARLEAQREEENWRQRATALATELHAPLAQLATASTQRALVTPRMLLTGAYLVERDRMEVFRQKVAASNAAHPALQFLCTGPWPPYNFVTTAVPQAGR